MMGINKSGVALVFASVLALVAQVIAAQESDSSASQAQQSSSEKAEKKIDTKVKELSGISIIGNKEAPKSLYIVPWKSSEVGVETGLNSSLLDPRLQPLDKEVFMRELEFYQLSQSQD